MTYLIVFTDGVPDGESNRQCHDHQDDDPVPHLPRTRLPLMLYFGPSPEESFAMVAMAMVC